MLNYSALLVAGTFCFDDGKYASVVVTLMMLCCFLSRQPNSDLGTRVPRYNRCFGRMPEREDDDENDPDHPAST